jgi:hypothetical protein
MGRVDRHADATGTPGSADRVFDVGHVRERVRSAPDSRMIPAADIITELGWRVEAA